jgi:hypothetical protein
LCVLSSFYIQCLSVCAVQIHLKWGEAEWAILFWYNFTQISIPVWKSAVWLIQQSDIYGYFPSKQCSPHFSFIFLKNLKVLERSTQIHNFCPAQPSPAVAFATSKASDYIPIVGVIEFLVPQDKRFNYTKVWCIFILISHKEIMSS